MIMVELGDEPIVVFDLDGVCAHSAWRIPVIKSEGYPAFHSLCKHDEPDPAMRDLVLALKLRDYQCIACTGRPEAVRSMTTEWLTRHGFEFSAVLMRPDEDYTPSPQLKPRLLAEALGPDWHRKIAAVFDDRDDVLAEFSARHITTYQVTLSRDVTRLHRGTKQ